MLIGSDQVQCYQILAKIILFNYPSTYTIIVSVGRVLFWFGAIKFWLKLFLFTPKNYWKPCRIQHSSGLPSCTFFSPIQPILHIFENLELLQDIISIFRAKSSLEAAEYFKHLHGFIANYNVCGFSYFETYAHAHLEIFLDSLFRIKLWLKLFFFTPKNCWRPCRIQHSSDLPSCTFFSLKQP